MQEFPLIFAAGNIAMDLRHRQRAFLSLFFFLSGFCFASWTSRIPTIKANFGYNEAELGTILLSMPISSLIGLPFSGWLVSRYESRIPLIGGFILLSLATLGIGFATTTVWLVASVSLLSFSFRILNISLNTQAIHLQKLFDRKINGSFHGLWSTGGIAGVGFSTLLVGLDVAMDFHLAVVAAIVLSTALYGQQYLLRNDRAATGNRLMLGKPDPYIVYLGLIVFFAAICEGGMFDWGGVFFKEVVHVEIFTWGYLFFMISMALSRFASDRVIEMIGMQRTYIISASLIFTGIALSVSLPYFWTSLIGFCFVGLGTAAIIPMTFTLAGYSQKYSPGMAISIIATYSIVGMLVGPPLIGYLAHAFDLRLSFVTFAIAGLALIPISRLFFSYVRSSGARFVER
ncbi:MAG TPA: MFS transporter [Chryseosolibacter sp.]|nr:MFS transporter [Chryseosolibacter sp.]